MSTLLTGRVTPTYHFPRHARVSPPDTQRMGNKCYTPHIVSCSMDLPGKAHALEITIEYGELPEGWWGAWNHRTKTIRMIPGLGAVQHRSVLAHELAHAIHGHTQSTPETEREARETAARLLLTPAKFSAAAKSSNWLGVLARELGVLPSDVAAFYESITAQEFAATRYIYEMEPRGF